MICLGRQFLYDIDRAAMADGLLHLEQIIDWRVAMLHVRRIFVGMLILIGVSIGYGWYDQRRHDAGRIPLYPHAQAVVLGPAEIIAVDSGTRFQRQQVLSFTTTDSLEQIEAFYAQRLPDEGWQPGWTCSAYLKSAPLQTYQCSYHYTSPFLRGYGIAMTTETLSEQQQSVKIIVVQSPGILDWVMW
jgi:hypothetical protein